MNIKLINCIALILICTYTFAANYAVFPLCPKNIENQSERLNKFHYLLIKATEKLTNASKAITTDSDIANCETSKRRNLASLLKAENFMEGFYLISSDSVFVQIKFANTRFVDKFSEEKKLKGISQKLTELVKQMISTSFNLMDIHPNPKEWVEINSVVKQDEGLYNTTSINNSSDKEFYNLGLLAYKLEKYADAKDYFAQVPKTDPNYADATFLMGKSYLFFGDYNLALAAFNESKLTGNKKTICDEYINSAKKMNKPADYYETPSKRRTWWESLSADELKAVIKIMDNLKINGNTFDEKYSYDDNDIAQLFKSSTLVLTGLKIQSLQFLTPFTRADIIIIENTNIKSLELLDRFINLKAIRLESNSSLVKSIESLTFIKEKNIKLIFTE